MVSTAENKKKLYTIPEVAEATGMSRRSIYRFWNTTWRDHGLKVYKGAPGGVPHFDINNVLDVMGRIANQAEAM